MLLSAIINEPAPKPVALIGAPTTRFAKLAGATLEINGLFNAVSALNTWVELVPVTIKSVRASKLPVAVVIVDNAVPPNVLAIVIAPVPVLTVLT